MILRSLEARLAKVERRLFHRTRGIHRYTDTELAGLISWLKNPDPADEAWALGLFQREGLLP